MIFAKIKTNGEEFANKGTFRIRLILYNNIYLFANGAKGFFNLSKYGFLT
jgi:hypothetical protein